MSGINFKMEFMKNILSKENKLNIILIFFVAILGSLILIIPIQYLLAIFLLLCIFLYFIFKPQHCYYLLIFTIPFRDRIRELPFISFSVNEIFILTCTVSVILNIFFRNEKVNLRTKIDVWLVALLILYFEAGFYSLNPRALLSSFKFLEAVLAFYLTVYFIRTKKVKITYIVKAFLFTGLFQALLGILQSSTGQFGAGQLVDRGILGYLGVGPTVVRRAVGTFGGTGGLAEILATLTFFIWPFCRFLNKKKKIFILFIFITAIYMGYGKLPFMELRVCWLFYLIYTSKNTKAILSKLSKFLTITLGVILLSFCTPFAATIYDSIQTRFLLWKYPIYMLSNDIHLLLFGSGLNSYYDLLIPILPQNQIGVYTGSGTEYSNWLLVHNYYLLVIQEMGLVGFFILFSFFFYLIKIFNTNYFQTKSSNRKIFLSGFLVILPVFISSLFGQLFMEPAVKIMFFIFWGVALSKINIKDKKFV